MRGNAGMAAEYVMKEAAHSLRAAHYVLKSGSGGGRPVSLTRGYFGEGKTLGWARNEVDRLMYGLGRSDGWEVVPFDKLEVADTEEWV
jgi:hypothetical protein